MTPFQWPNKPDGTIVSSALLEFEDVFKAVRGCPYIHQLAPATAHLVLLTLAQDLHREHRPVNEGTLALALTELEGYRLQLHGRYREWFSELELGEQIELALAQRRASITISLPSTAV